MWRARAACVGQHALVDRELLLEDRAQVLHRRALPERESPSPLYPSGGETAMWERRRSQRAATASDYSARQCRLIRLSTSERSSSSNAVSRAPLPSGATASGLGGSTIRNCFCDRPAPVDAGRRRSTPVGALRRGGDAAQEGGRAGGRAGALARTESARASRAGRALRAPVGAMGSRCNATQRNAAQRGPRPSGRCGGPPLGGPVPGHRPGRRPSEREWPPRRRAGISAEAFIPFARALKRRGLHCCNVRVGSGRVGNHRSIRTVTGTASYRTA